MIVCATLAALALNTYHEARGEPFHGQVAVAQVVLRRANFRPAHVCAVIWRKSQFSWTAADPPVRNPEAWYKAVRAAQIALLWAHGGAETDYSAGADHYHSTAVSPGWAASMARVTTIGRHQFYDSRRQQ